MSEEIPESSQPSPDALLYFDAPTTLADDQRATALLPASGASSGIQREYVLAVNAPVRVTHLLADPHHVLSSRQHHRGIRVSPLIRISVTGAGTFQRGRP